MTNIAREDISKGYEPVTRLEANIMGSPQALTKMRFAEAEIAKMAIGFKARTEVLKSAKTVSRNISKTLRGENTPPIISAHIVCDICTGTTGIGIAKLTTAEQRTNLSSGCILVKLGQDRDYIVVPPGVIIDYSKGKVHIVCGTCQLLLGLRATESGTLIHEMRNGHGFVDLDRIDTLIQEHGR